jgi:hypothetical protein
VFSYYRILLHILTTLSLSLTSARGKTVCVQAFAGRLCLFHTRSLIGGSKLQKVLCVCVCVCVCVCAHTHIHTHTHTHTHTHKHTHTHTHTHTHVTGGVSRKPHARGRGTPVHSAGHPNRNNLGRSSQVENLFVCARLFSLDVCVHMCVCACASVCECVCNIYV